MKKNIVIILCLFLCDTSLLAQPSFKGFNTPACQECRNKISNFPKEIRYNLFLGPDSMIYLNTTSRRWIDTLYLRNNELGIAVEVVSKDMFSCDIIRPYNITEPIYGQILDPVFRSELLQHIEYAIDSTVLVPIARLPEYFQDKEIEFNYFMVVQDNYCMRHKFYNLDSYRWNMLEMGFFVDSLLMKDIISNSMDSLNNTFNHSKSLKFEIPFKKDRSDYLPEDIRSLYDSLELSDFTIKEIYLRAYASIEGSRERNIVLQEERAQAIVDALQEYQNPEILTDINSMENWVEFLQDVKSTEHSYLSDLSREEIRQRVNTNNLDNELEPILKNHRKAIVILKLEKKVHYSSITENELIEKLEQALSENRIKEAIEIQNSIFRSIENESIPPESIDSIEIPHTIDYSLLLNRQLMFQLGLNLKSISEVIEKLEELHTLIPQDDHIFYNLVSMKLQILPYLPMDIDLSFMIDEIDELSKTSIPKNLITRMRINYEIVMCERFMKKEQYRQKDKSVMMINSMYKSIDLDDGELLILSQFFASYLNTNLATRILEKRTMDIDVEEDILFFYINLTIAEEKYMRDQGYRLILQNAHNLNPVRFCSIFSSNMKDGITFQLLENNYLRKIYCGNCW